MSAYEVFTQHGSEFGGEFIVPCSYVSRSPEEAAQRRFDAMAYSSQGNTTALLVVGGERAHVFPVRTRDYTARVIEPRLIV